MAPMKPNNNNCHSSNYGEGIVRQANILASCYVVDPSAASLKGLHYCTTDLTGAECPPLAAITATNELALTPKAKSAHRTNGSGRSGSSNSARQHRRGGATSRIRGECERFFCETLRATFLGERDEAQRGSGLTDVYHRNQRHDRDYRYQQHDDRIDIDHRYYNGSRDGFDGAGDRRALVDANGQLTPPDYYPIGDRALVAIDDGMTSAYGGNVGAWLEIWDYAGGNSFRGFVAQNVDDKSLFVFFDSNVLGRDLKQALVALIELAEGPLDCSHMVICIERSITEEERKPLMTGLQWAGFSLTTLDYWTGGMDVTSSRWLFMGMEV